MYFSSERFGPSTLLSNAIRTAIVVLFALFFHIQTSGLGSAQSTQIAGQTPLPQLAPIPRFSPLQAAPISSKSQTPAASTSTPKPADTSLDRKIGQMLMMGFRGTNANQAWPRKLRSQIRNGQVGGVLFLGHNVASAGGVKSLTKLFNGSGAAIQPFVSIDQEGGLVERLGRKVGFREIPSARQVALKSNVEGARATYLDLAKRLRAWGFNTNYGPVTDLIANPSNPIIARKNRSFSSRADIATKFGKAFVDGHRQAGMVTALKHFPGHGSSLSDSHRGFTNITNTWSQNELKPFQTLIGQRAADMVMVGHLYLKPYAPRTSKPIPASLSKPLIEGLLRSQLGYQGVVITDDLDMGAIRQHFSQSDTVLRAVRAGVDILILSNSARPDPDLPAKVIALMKKEAQRDPQFRKRINASYARILALKKRMGIMR